MTNIQLKETLTIEFKSDQKKLSDSDLIDVVVAFANTNGGDLYLGVEDDGMITGLHKEHMDITRLTAFVANKTVPPVGTRAEILTFAKIPVLKLTVPRYTTIVASSSGHLLRRRIKADGSPENIPMYPYEITSRLSSLSLLDYSAQAVPDAKYDDLDPLERERLRNIIRDYHGETTLLDLDDLELDKALRLVTTIEKNLYPTLTGILLIGKKDRLRQLVPTAESAIQVMDGTDLRVNESFTLPLLASIEKINSYFNAWNKEEEMEIGLFRIPIPHYDSRAFREALINAFSHRDYSLLGRVRILIDSTGMTISNPGGFVNGITYKNLIDAEPRGRNPVLADCLKRIGLAERSGRGIDRIYAGSLQYGKNLPDYSESTNNLVKLYIPDNVPDKAFIQMLSSEQKKNGRSFSVYDLMILNCLKQQHRLSVKELENTLGLPSYKVKMTVESLTELGILEAIGTGTGRYYVLSSKLYKAKHDLAGYVRQTDIDALRHTELVLKLLKKQGSITRADVVNLLRINPPQAYRLLNKLKEKGTINLQGKGKSACYKLH
jgi:Predicted transcriptional regulator containing an HTH domain and an uncharacterized domain shared with the mammalian protein Schlafen